MERRNLLLVLAVERNKENKENKERNKEKKEKEKEGEEGKKKNHVLPLISGVSMSELIEQRSKVCLLDESYAPRGRDSSSFSLFPP